MAEDNFSKTKKRTVVYVKNLEELLSNNNTIEGRSNIADFNDFADLCSEKYHTTILVEVKNPEKMESSSRSRFEPVVELNQYVE
jgi:hypothetical protein